MPRNDKDLGLVSSGLEILASIVAGLTPGALLMSASTHQLLIADSLQTTPWWSRAYTHITPWLETAINPRQLPMARRRDAGATCSLITRSRLQDVIALMECSRKASCLIKF